MRRTHYRSTFWMSLLMLTALALPALAQRRYTITAIGPLPGDTQSITTSINESDRLVGISFNETYQGTFYTAWPPFPDTTLAFLLDHGTLTPLLPPAGYHGTWTYGQHGINARGQIVGTAAKVDPNTILPDWNGHPLLIEKVPVLWEKPNSPRILPLPAGYTHGSPWAINNRGEVIGWAGTDLGINSPIEYWMLGVWEVAVHWDSHGSAIVLPNLFPGGTSAGSSINDNGQITGTSSAPDFSTTHGVLWDRGQVIDLTPDAPGYSEAATINNRGQVVGYTDAFGHGYLWDNGVLTDLGVVEDDPWSWALGLNNKGQVVGFSSGPEGDTFGRGFLWENGEMIDLNDLFDDPGDMWKVTWAYAINEKEEIVGFAFRKNASGEYITTGFLLTPIP